MSCADASEFSAYERPAPEPQAAGASGQQGPAPEPKAADASGPEGPAPEPEPQAAGSSDDWKWQGYTSSGQSWSSEVDWKLHRRYGYNSGGLQARLRRNMLRMQQQMLNQQREAMGLPCPTGSLSAQMVYEKARDIGQALKESMVFRVGLEKAHAQAAADNIHMSQLGKALAPQPPWRSNPQSVPAPPFAQGQPFPMAPSLSPPSVPRAGLPSPAPTGQHGVQSIGKAGLPSPAYKVPYPAQSPVPPAPWLHDMAPQPKVDSHVCGGGQHVPQVNVWLPNAGASQGLTGTGKSSSSTDNMQVPGSTSKSAGSKWPPPPSHDDGQSGHDGPVDC